MTFELEIEVRPTFVSPSLDNMSVKRPVRELSDADLDRQYKAFLERYADVVPKEDEPAELGDLITADLIFTRDGTEVNTAKDIQFRVQPELRFQDGRVPDCGVALAGVKAGESRTTKAIVGSASADPNLRGQEIDVTFHVKDVKYLRLPEVDELFLLRIGFDTEDELKSALKEVLQSRLESNQRQAVRNDLMNQLIAAVPFDLPRDLVNRQTRDTLRKRLMDLRESGLTDAQLRASESELRSNAFESTVRGLKEYFILDKIAADNNIKVEPEDVDLEIARMADREDSTPRRIRARLERENSMDFLAIQIIENKTIDFILGKVNIEDVAMDDEKDVETLDESAAPGGLVDPESEVSENSEPSES
jgi:trigger factor